MSRPRNALCLCLFCALVFSAAMAQSAMAIPTGTTGFTCSSKAALKDYSDVHCKTFVGSGGSFGHVTITDGVVTEVIESNESTGGATVPSFLASTISGVEVQLEATGVSASGTGENMKDGTSGEHTVLKTGTITYTGVTVSKPAGLGCKVFETEALANEKMVSTTKLKATSAGQGMAVKIEPNEGTTFANFWISGCSITALNGKYSATGSVKTSSIEGATTLFTHANTTEQGTLKLRGQVAGLNGLVTTKGRANPTEEFTPISPTTVATP